MVDWWWGLAGAAIPAMVVQQIVRRSGGRQSVEAPGLSLSSPSSSSSASSSSSSSSSTGVPGSKGGFGGSNGDVFACERVCTSDRLLKKVGAFSKEPHPNTCVTVCGVSEVDACADACARTVCVNPHHVPNWNDACLRRCQSQCLKLQSAAL